MNQTQVPFRRVHADEDGRTKLLDGVAEIETAVSSTLGAGGKTVILEHPAGGPYITKDGVTVAEYVNPYDPVANLGASLLREAAKKTASDAGDGTTTSIVLAKAILDNVIPKLTATNFRVFQDGIKIGRDKIVSELENRSTDVTKDNLIDIASISANNDRTIGNLIAEAYSKVGMDGTVAIGESMTNDTYVDMLDGSSINSGYASPHFKNSANKCNLKGPSILILDQTLQNVWKIQELLESALKDNQSLVIVGQLEPNAIATLAMNVRKLGMKICVIDPPLHGAQRQAVLSDLALLTGANVVGEEYGNSLDTVSFKDLGKVKSVSIEDSRSIFKFNKTTKTKEVIKELKNRLVNAQGPEKGLIKYRLNLLTGKLAEIKVGAITESAFKELKDRVDDAVQATRCALQEGFVAGGGVVLKDIANMYGDSKNPGESALYAAIMKPIKTILNNGGYDIKDLLHIDKIDWGMNVLNGKEVNVKEVGIIDPTKVTKNAVINACEVAHTILGTDIILTTLRASDVPEIN